MSRFRTLTLSLLALVSFLCLSAVVQPCQRANAEPPQPSPYPVSWKLDFDSGKPARIVVEVPGKSVPEAYWYLPYKVTNNTQEERMFLPVFELVDDSGKITRSDNKIAPSVINAIKQREGNRFIQSSIFAAGELRLGADEAKYGVAVWPAASTRMGHFTILAGGLSGEFTKIKNAEGNDVTLRKTLQLNYHINGEETLDKDTAVIQDASQSIMR